MNTMLNEIILRDGGNTYCGDLASKFSYGRYTLPKVFKLDQLERFHVFEVVGDEVIHRAGQFHRGDALRYMGENCVLVWREDEHTKPQWYDLDTQHPVRRVRHAADTSPPCGLCHGFGYIREYGEQIPCGACTEGGDA